MKIFKFKFFTAMMLICSSAHADLVLKQVFEKAQMTTTTKISNFGIRVETILHGQPWQTTIYNAAKKAGFCDYSTQQKLQDA
jgi:hypothetical protein